MPTSKRKPRSFTFTLSDTEYSRLKRLADTEGRSMANYLRCLIRLGGSTKGPAPTRARSRA